MDIGDYYSKSINGFTKNPLLAIPTGVGYFLVYFISFLLALGVFALYGTEIFNYSQYAAPNMTTPDLGTLSMFLGVLFGIILIVGVVNWIISCIISAATIGMSERIVLGEKTGLNVGLKYVKKYLLKLLAVSLIFGILVAIMLIPLIIGIILLGFYPNNDLIIVGPVIGGLITLILLIVVYLFFIFTFQSVIIGKKSIIGSFKDSYKTVRKNIFEVVVVLVINLVIILAIGVILAFINLFLGIIPLIGSLFALIVQIIVYAVILPYFTLVLNYLYMDLKDMIPEESEYGY